jgi:hypothetical protein
MPDAFVELKLKSPCTITVTGGQRYVNLSVQVILLEDKRKPWPVVRMC